MPRADEQIQVIDSEGKVLHQPPPVDEFGLVDEGRLRQRKQRNAFVFVAPPDVAKRLQR